MYLAAIVEEMSTFTRVLNFDVEYDGDRWAVTIEPPRACLGEESHVFYPHMLDVRCKTSDSPSMIKLCQALSVIQQALGYRTYGTLVYSVRSVACFIVRAETEL